MPESVEPRAVCPIVEDDGSAIDKTASRNRARSRVFNRREYARRAGTAGGRGGSLRQVAPTQHYPGGERREHACVLHPA